MSGAWDQGFILEIILIFIFFYRCASIGFIYTIL
jgi:hypothetical protein